MKKAKPLLALLLVFLAGLVLGVVGTRVVMRNVIRRAIMHPEWVREQIQRDLVRRLKLDPAQQTQVHAVLADSQRQLRDLRMEFQPQFALIMSNSQTRIAAILKPEQLEKFEKFREENRRFLQSSPIPSGQRPRAAGQ